MNHPPTPSHRGATPRGRVAVAVAVLLVAGACRGGDDDSPEPGARPRDDSTPETTGVDDLAEDWADVVAAREAALDAEMASLAPTGANPDLPALRETMTGTALQAAVATAYQELCWIPNQGHEPGENCNAAYRWPDGSVHRLTVQSVTFPADRDGTAFLETCLVDDREHVVVPSGEPHWWPPENGTPHTVQFTEEMRFEGGVWKLAESFENRRWGDVGGCAEQQPLEPVDDGGGDNDLKRAVVKAREAAEQDWLAGLIDPGRPIPEGTYTGYLLEWFKGRDAALDLPYDERLRGSTPEAAAIRCPFPIPERTQITPEMFRTDPCVRPNYVGSNQIMFFMRGEGLAATPDSTARVVVDHVDFPQVDKPSVGYLATCRTWDVRRVDGHVPESGYQPDPGLLRATVRSVETMHLDGDQWKLSGRWGFVVDDTAAGCG